MSDQPMLISDVVLKYPEDEIFYIGGQSGFFYIGSGKDVLSDIADINFRQVCILVTRYEMAKNGGTKRKYDRAIKNWMDLQERPVKEYYERIEDGIAIILDNSEDLNGKYWFKEEYEHEHQKNRIE